MRLKNKNPDNKLLKEYISLLVRNLLKEQDDYGDYGDYAGYGGGGGDVNGEGFKSDFARLFGFDSVKNAFDAGQYAVETTLRTAVGEVKILAKSLLFYLIPFIRPDETSSILEMAEKDREEIESELERVTDRKYGEMLKRNSEMFNNPDFQFAGFLANPGLYLANEIRKESVGKAITLYDSIVGQDSYRRQSSEEVSNALNNLFGSVMRELV